jgi:CelD/BcsL family acetyltransferase involved in cellulose biosynthesis
MLHGWLTTWWRHFGTDGRLTLHIARIDGKLVGALPFFVRSAAGGLEIAQFLGGDQSALADLLVAEDAGETVAKALCEQAAAGGQDVADLFGLPADSMLAAALGPERMTLVLRVESPVLDISPGWDAVYQAKTSSKKRNLHRRRRRQLAELGDARSVIARTPDDLERALEEAFRLHELRWSGRPDGSRFATPQGRSFHRDAIRALTELDAPRIVLLELDGRAIAFHYYFAFCGRMYVHRLAFDPEFARASPGLVNTLDAIEAAAAEGLHTVEFLGADERYKVELADRFEPMYQGFGLTGSVRGRALVTARLASIRLRRRLKRSPTIKRLYFEGLAPLHRALAARRAR